MCKMGFNTSDFKFLLSGIEGKTICTLGKLNLFMSQSDARKVSGRPVALPTDPILFADDLLTPLGYDVTSMDASPYEGANIIHDLNEPIPENLVEKFDIVWDGGTLEHIFDYPSALRNAMQMVKIGGHFACRTPANNQCGHGFYQFSPELFYRIMVPENGFEIVRIYVTRGGKFFHVVDPKRVGVRVELLDDHAALLMVHARKVGPVPSRLAIPQQSDYVASWSNENVDGKLKAMLRRILSPGDIERISRVLNWARQKRAVRRWKARSRLSNRAFYRPVVNWKQPTREVWDT